MRQEEKRTSFVVSATVVHRLEFRPVDALVAIVINLPNHVLDLSLERTRVVEGKNDELELSMKQVEETKTPRRETHLFGSVVEELKHRVQFVRVNFTIPASPRRLRDVQMNATRDDFTLWCQAFQKLFEGPPLHFF